MKVLNLHSIGPSLANYCNTQIVGPICWSWQLFSTIKLTNFRMHNNRQRTNKDCFPLFVRWILKAKRQFCWPTWFTKIRRVKLRIGLNSKWNERVMFVVVQFKIRRLNRREEKLIQRLNCGGRCSNWESIEMRERLTKQSKNKQSTC